MNRTRRILDNEWQNRLKQILENEWQPLGFIPNKEGFKFLGLTKDGQVLDCIVVLVEGMHCAYDTNTGEPCFKQLRGWKNKQ